MKRLLASVLTALLVVTMTLAAVFLLTKASLVVAKMTNPLMRAVAVIAELVLGVVLLLGTVYLAVRLAVRIFGGGPPPQPD
ncbi:MAG: hypothetical protein DMG28_14570 [Acidobacteria bacterium]|nr:MAG: hypothetical protein DMG28_14570 [Acidobacteriota bacterium]